MEFVGVALRWLQLGAGLGLIGSFFLLLLSGPNVAPAAVRWRDTVLAATRWLAGLLLLVGLGLLMVQTASVSGRAESALRWADISRLLENSRFGIVWQARQAIVLALLILLVARNRLVAWSGERGFDALLFILAVMHATAAVLTGHGAATEPIWLAGSGHLVHLLAAGLWAGGLPALILGLRLAARSDDPAARTHFATALRRFSVVATASVLLLVVSGSVIGYLQLGAPRQWPGGGDGLLAGLFTLLERTAAPLIASNYGLLVLAKISLLVPVLLVAARVRFVCMPRVGDIRFDQQAVFVDAVRLVRVELTVVLLILLAAATISGTLPAAHDQLVWPFSFRFSVAATWGGAWVAWRVTGGVLLLIISVVLGAAARQHLRGIDAKAGAAQARGLAAMAAVTLLGGIALSLPALTVDAYPDTYRRTDTAYAAVSVARGAELFDQHCIACHGAGGKGDGPTAARLPKPPANLTEPHTALHTAGDLFWWLTHGKPAGGMPGFESQMSVEERWDMVNFLRAFSSGFQARILTPAVVPGRPWLAPPDFDFTTTVGTSAALKDYRERQAVLLVFYTLPMSQARLDQLTRSYAALRARNTEVLALPLPDTRGPPPDALPYPQVSDGAHGAAMAYLLLRRTLADPGRSVLGEPPPHLEFLIDRFGYARARWLPADTVNTHGGDWRDMGFLLRQIDLINAEPRLLPSPDDHVH
ncbi:c-type cytochrome [Rhodoferax ferrireducens]|uniref:c-type cytochrome n=1 Tax=Rhodoferax ferrireducens TaxID=192843 RepID=UPI000E0DC0E1|nr:c-type cytochrome [Rhodoferax ferrireducens]